MTRIRRYFISGAPVFITAVCHQRHAHLRANERKALLLAVVREVKREIPFKMIGFVLLDEHFHWLIRPHAPDAFPRIMQSVKLRFARRILPELRGTTVHIWQRRYWDHVIRDAEDLRRHLDYIHYNPVKHGLVQAPADYRWSSFREYLHRGQYPAEWGSRMPEGIDGLVPE